MISTLISTVAPLLSGALARTQNAGIITVSGAPTVAGATTAVASNVTANSQLLNNSMPGVVVMNPVVNGSISNTSSTEATLTTLLLPSGEKREMELESAPE